MQNAIRVVIAGIVIVIALQLGIVLMDGITADEDGIRVGTDELILVSANEYTEIDTGAGYDETVRDTRNKSVRLDGSDDSFVESDRDLVFASDETWTYATWARINAGAESNDMTAVSFDGRVVIAYNATRTEWVGWYYDESDRDSYAVNVSAPNQPANLSNVALVNNGSHITIYRNGTAGESQRITVNNTESAPVEDTNWNGSLDETRTFDDDLSATERQTLVNDPIAPLPGTNRTSRIMYDQPGRSQTIFFTGSELTVSNVEFVSGLFGQVLVEGVDYAWDTDGPRIKTLAGGEVDGAPGVYVVYDFEGALSGVINGFTSFVGLAALLPLLLIISVILLRVRAMG